VKLPDVTGAALRFTASIERNNVKIIMVAIEKYNFFEHTNPPIIIFYKMQFNNTKGFLKSFQHLSTSQ